VIIDRREDQSEPVISSDPEAHIGAPELAPEDDEVHDGQLQDDGPVIDDDDGEEG